MLIIGMTINWMGIKKKALALAARTLLPKPYHKAGKEMPAYNGVKIQN
jgi:hypothetical protein